MKTVGITGGVGTGKSTVAALLTARHGVPVVDADAVARDVVAVGSPGLARVVEAFGNEVLTPTGALDRQAMRARIVASADARRQLEHIVHPLIAAGVADRLADLASAGHAWAGVEAALMVETGSYRMYDALIVVSCSPETQVARVMARDGVSAEAARALLATQLPLATKEAVATVVVRNEGALADLEAAVDAAWAQIGGPLAASPVRVQ